MKGLGSAQSSVPSALDLLSYVHSGDYLNPDSFQCFTLGIIFMKYVYRDIYIYICV